MADPSTDPGQAALATLVHELGIESLPQEEQEALVAGFSEVAIKAATAAVLEQLPEPQREEFATLAEAGDGAALQAFLNREVPGHEALAGAAVRDELTRFKAAVAA